MNRKTVGAILLLAMALGLPAQGSVLTLTEQTIYGGLPYTDAPTDITTVGNLDWVVIDYSEKADATAITTYNGGNTALLEVNPWDTWEPSTGFPTFNWSDGFNLQMTDPANPAPAGITRSDDPDPAAPRVSTHIAIPAGSGQLTVWWVYAMAGGVEGGMPAFTTSFADGTTLTVDGGPDVRKTVVDYSTDTAQTLTFNMNYNAGLFAMAVSSVPEPSTMILLGLGLLALPVHIWRKRK
jgi:hypothetical protein